MKLTGPDHLRRNADPRRGSAHLPPLQRTPPSSTVTAVPLMTAAVLSAWTLSQSFPPEVPLAGLLMMLMVGTMLLLHSPLTAALLFLSQLVFAVTERGSLDATVTFYDQIIAGSLLLMLMSLQRYLQRPQPVAVRRTLEQVSSRLRLPRWLRLAPAAPTGSDPACLDQHAVRETMALGVRVTAAVVLAAWLLTGVPIDLRAPDDVGLIPTAQRTIRLTITIALVTVVANTLFNGLAWRRLTPKAARLFHQATLTDWCGRELRTILRLQEKKKRRRT